MPAYEVLKARHAHFHRCAGDVLAVAQKGERDKALQMLEHGAYPDASHHVATRLQSLGFTQIHIMIDGYPGWKDKSFPVVEQK